MEKLQQELSNMQADVSSFMSLFEGLKESSATARCEDYDFTPYCIDESSFIVSARFFAANLFGLMVVD